MILRIQMAWPWQCLESQGCGVSGDQPAALLHLYWGPVKLAASLQSPRLEALLMYSAVPSWEVSCEKSQGSYVLQELDQRYLW